MLTLTVSADSEESFVWFLSNIGKRDSEAISSLIDAMKEQSVLLAQMHLSQKSMESKMDHNVDELISVATQTQGVEASVLQIIQGFRARLDALAKQEQFPAGTQAKMNSLFDQATANVTAMVDAVKANPSQADLDDAAKALTDAGQPVPASTDPAAGG